METRFWDLVFVVATVLASSPHLAVWFAWNFNLFLMTWVPILAVVSIVVSRFIRYLTKVPRSLYIFAFLMALTLAYGSYNYLSATRGEYTLFISAIGTWIGSFYFFRSGLIARE